MHFKVKNELSNFQCSVINHSLELILWFGSGMLATIVNHEVYY